MKTLSYRDVILKEKEQLLLRRQKLNITHGSPEQENWFGIALSGGGIRSATINLGFLKTLNRFGMIDSICFRQYAVPCMRPGFVPFPITFQHKVRLLYYFP